MTHPHVPLPPLTTDQALKETQQRFQALVKAIEGTVWTNNAEGQMVGLQPGWSALTGQTYEEYQGYGWSTAVHPEDAQPTIDAWEKAVKTRSVFLFEHRVLCRDGEWRLFSIRAVPIFNEDGSIREWIGIHTDITEQRETDDALKHRLAELKTIMEAMPQMVWCTLPDGYHYYFNQRWYDYTGTSADQVQGDGWNPQFHSDDQRKAWRAWRHSLQTGEPYEIEYRLKAADGSYRWFLGRALPVRDEQTGEILRWFGTCTDIEDIVKAREVLARSQEELEKLVSDRTQQLQAVNKELETFSYSVSHDLRAPLRSIDGFSLALLKDHASSLDAQAQDYLTRIRSASQRMARLIDDILQLSRLTRLPLKTTRVNLSTLAQAIMTELQILQPYRQVEVDIQPDIVAQADPQLMQIALQNLLENAWKFTSLTPNAVIRFFTATNDAGQREYIIQDNGAGFEMQYVNKLFGPFQRLHAMTEYPGTGVGLATVARVIHRHYGAVRAEGAVNQGATFYFTLG